MNADFDGVVAVVTTYFDGLYHSDTARLRQVFHPQAHYVSATDGTLLYRTMENYYAVVDVRPSPASRGEVRRDEVLSIDFAGPVTARVSLHCAIGARHFTDFLTLIRLEGRWQVISKVFHYTEES